MPPTSTDGDDGQTRRFDRVSDGEPARRTRRPAERTAKRAPEPSTSLADKVTDWVAAIIGAEDEEDDGTKNGHTTTRTRRSPSRTAAPARTRQRPAAVRTAAPRHDEEPSWLLRAAAIALLGLLMVALLLLLTSIL
jgi:hypothetical protein